MAVKLLTNEEYETLFRHWKREHGVLGQEFNTQRYHTVPKLPDPRKEMLTILIEELITTYGYTESDLRASNCFGRIVNTCVNLKTKDKKKLRDWIDFVTTDLNEVIDSYFPKKEWGKVKDRPEVVKSTKVEEPIAPYQKRSKADIIPDVPFLDRSRLTGPAPAAVLDETIDIFAPYDDGNNS